MSRLSFARRKTSRKTNCSGCDFCTAFLKNYELTILTGVACARQREQTTFFLTGLGFDTADLMQSAATVRSETDDKTNEMSMVKNL